MTYYFIFNKVNLGQKVPHGAFKKCLRAGYIKDLNGVLHS